MNQLATLTEPVKKVRSAVDLYEAEACGLCRENFALFRQYIRPTMLWDWWLADAANHLQKFYEDMLRGKRPKLCLQAPPQHGKSWTVEDFVAWVIGRNPDLKVIFASYADSLGVRINKHLQRTIWRPEYQKLFPRTQIGLPGWICNNDLFEFVGRSGSFRNVTVNGGVNGHELNLGIIDDPIKGRAEANSTDIRNKTWNWFVDDFFARFANSAGMLIICTRWHVDDLVGRFIERYPGEITTLRYQAIAEANETYQLAPDKPPHVRKAGEPLFPKHKPLDFLLERKAVLTQGGWSSEYQQHPIIVGGGALPIERLKVSSVATDRSKVRASIRYVDKAGTEDAGAYTAALLMHAMSDGTYVIEHVARGQWSVADREIRIRQLADADKATWPNYSVWVEQEPGSGGKESAEATIRSLAGHAIYADKVGKSDGNKMVRAEPFAAQVQHGNVKLVAGDWVIAFLDECEHWPFGKYKDQVDAAAGAFNKLVEATAYNTNYAAWV